MAGLSIEGAIDIIKKQAALDGMEIGEYLRVRANTALLVSPANFKSTDPHILVEVTHEGRVAMHGSYPTCEDIGKRRKDIIRKRIDAESSVFIVAESPSEEVVLSEEDLGKKVIDLEATGECNISEKTENLSSVEKKIIMGSKTHPVFKWVNGNSSMK
jgi:hypothetical protein